MGFVKKNQENLLRLEAEQLALENKTGRCDSCKFGRDHLTYAPGISGPRDGVDCQNIKQVQDMVGRYGYPAEMLAEFIEHGSVNLFRIEIIAEPGCENWEA